MSKVKERLLEKIAQTKTKEVTFLGEKILCKVRSMKELAALKDADKMTTEEYFAFMAGEFLDPVSREPLFTTEYLMENASMDLVSEMTKAFKEANGQSVKDASLRKVEKKLKAQKTSRTSK